VVSSNEGRVFGPTEDSVFAVLDNLVEPEGPTYQVHPAAYQVWGRNLDGVDPAATKAALDATVVSTKEEAEGLLEQGTRRAKTTDEIKELRRRLAGRMKKRFPEVFVGRDQTHLPATSMPTSDFTTAAATAKTSFPNPFGTAGKQLDTVLKPLAEGLELRRQIIEVSSSEVSHQIDELRAAIEGGAETETLIGIIDNITADRNIQEVVSQEAFMLPFSIVADRFVDLAKQEKKANQGNLLSPAVLSQAAAAGIKVQVSPGSQKYLGSGSHHTRTPMAANADKAQVGKRKAQAHKRKQQKVRKNNVVDRKRSDDAKQLDNQQPPRLGARTPDKASGSVPGSKSPGDPNGSRPQTTTSAGKQPKGGKPAQKSKGQKGNRK